MTQPMWRRCSACKEPIGLGATYYVCSVSTCRQKRTGLVFCDVSCWEVHLPIARHREAWAEERKAPRTPEPVAGSGPTAAASASPSPRRRYVPAERRAGTPDAESDVPKEILIVASRLKEYVRARSGYNTSDRALGPLSDLVRKAVDEAIRKASADERKTVLDRDIPKP